MDKKLLLILNPTSGRGAAAGSLFSIVKGFSETGWETTVIPTFGKGDAQKIATQRAGDFPFLVCCGGDGTLNETINGLMARETRPLLGYIPTGTTNDFAATLGLPHNPEEAALKIGDGKPFCYDVGELNGRYFSYIAAFGIFTEISYSTPQPFKNVCGRVAYFLEGIRQLSSITHYRIRVDWDSADILSPSAADDHALPDPCGLGRGVFGRRFHLWSSHQHSFYSRRSDAFCGWRRTQ